MATISMPLFLSLLIICANSMLHLADATNKPVFILGDSTADVGTNNYIASTLKANFPHNGVDFPKRQATGRFSNGFNSADELAKLFELKMSPPPFLYLLTLGSGFQQHICNGVNFASGGAGLLDITNNNNTVPLSEQINQFTTVRNNFTAMIGEPATEVMLNKSLFFISIGSNDIFGYFNRSDGTPPDSFITMMLSAYSQYITTLYGLGARRLGIISVPPVGCCPLSRLIQLNSTGTNGCFPPMNDFAQAFHLALDGLLLNISSQLPEMKYSLGNTFNMTLDVINMPSNNSLFGTVDGACCGHGTLSAEGPCNRTAALCPDRNEYLFWDMFHPTQKSCYLAAQEFYNGPTYVSPISFSQLAQDN
ncbi:GDSL esterase/lipase At5g55050-like [Salvia miltiorrhiza]|uniref:GDSL esterase/lipase At5g55050-like n=1 Tax=Salvia miltiorrhiza TaxID=226208 RepID=UPI0025AD6FE4|nr:GDSL esterase/lipase At5g55050-like [Salvia miltiorrhiza]